MSNQIESYHRVIGVIGSADFADRAMDIVLRIAKLHPQTVVDAYNVEIYGNKYGVPEAIADILLSGQKIEAIKRYREEYTCSLKTAKDSIEAVIDAHNNLKVLFRPLG